jgi:hypothetical protein
MSAYVDPVEGEVDVSNNGLIDGYVNTTGLGYFIIVAGARSDGDLSDSISRGCNQVYRTLLDVGYGEDRIFYMNQPGYTPRALGLALSVKKRKKPGPSLFCD